MKVWLQETVRGWALFAEEALDDLTEMEMPETEFMVFKALDDAWESMQMVISQRVLNRNPAEGSGI